MTDIEHVVQDLERKANISREIHVYSSKKCKLWINLALILTIILTLVITFLSLAGPLLLPLNDNGKNVFGIIIAIAGLSVLFLSVSDRIFGLNERYATHNQGVKLLTDFIRDCHQFRHVGLKEQGEGENLVRLDALQREYSQLNQMLPINDISDREFLKCKQNCYLKVEVSKKLDEDPHLDIDEAMKTHKSAEIQKR